MFNFLHIDSITIPNFQDEQNLPFGYEIFTVDDEPDNKRVRQISRSKTPELDLSHISHLKPLGRRLVKPEDVAPSPYAPPPPVKRKKSRQHRMWSPDIKQEEPFKVNPLIEQQRKMFNQTDSSSRPIVATNIPAIIASAARKAQETRKLEEERAAVEAAEAAKRSKRAMEKQLRREKQQRSLSKGEKAELKEKRLQKLVGAVVVKCLSKYRDRMDREEFKKQAKEVSVMLITITMMEQLNVFLILAYMPHC